MSQAICKSREDETIVKFVDPSQLGDEIKDMIEDNQIWGVYVKDGSVVVEDIWGDIHETEYTI